MDDIKVFVSYSHEDKVWVEKGTHGLVRWLKDTMADGGVEFWFDHELRKQAGKRFQPIIVDTIKKADLSVLLVSQNFLASKFIREVELPLIKQRVDGRQMGVIPILVDFVNFKLAPQLQWITDRQMLPSEPEPLVTFLDNLARWYKVRADILDAIHLRVEEKRQEHQARGPDPAPAAPETVWRPETTGHEPDPDSAQEQAIEPAPPVREPDPVPALAPFDDKDQLLPKSFAFSLSEILIRATKRRNLQARAHISNQDLICGLVRKGDLTRTVLMILELEPDKVYQQIGGYRETGEPEDPERKQRQEMLLRGFKSGKMAKQELLELLNFWFVRDKADFAPESQMALAEAVAAASERGLSKVSELVFLDKLMKSPDWQGLTKAGLPSSQTFGKYLQRVLSEGRVDENGHWNFQGLDESASMVIGRVHALAQKYGCTPISHRVMLTSLVYDQNSFGRKTLAYSDMQPEIAVAFLVGSISTRGSIPFGLSYEACRPLLIPVVEEARRLAGSENLITDADLFWAFCRKAGKPFKSWLRTSYLSLDLEQIASMETRPSDSTLH